MQPLVAMRNIGKRFGRVRVLENVDLEIRPGEVHALAGENGAGKSTLIKILSGVYADYDGRIEIAGEVIRLRSPLDALRNGIAVIHQELSLVPSMSVADNLLLGRWPTVRGWLRRRTIRSAVLQAINQLGLDVQLDQPVAELPIATQQLLEIAKALCQSARVIVMDEPTSSLNVPEVEMLFSRIADLKSRGCGLVYITHKMEEIHRIADRVTVLRDGRHIGTAAAADLPPATLISWMVGRDVAAQIKRKASNPGSARFELRDFAVSENGRTIVEPLSLSVRGGEILGLAGLQGSGNSELLSGLFGVFGRKTSGTVRVDGKLFAVRSPRQAISAGLALLTSDRKATGLVLPLSVVANITLAGLPSICKAGWRRPGREYDLAAEAASRLQIHAAELNRDVGTLSGGNQQKAMLAKWWLTNPRVLLLDEPTRGIDIGAKHEIYDLINAWSAQGIAIILITSELPELLGLSDRILVLHRGRRTAELGRDHFSANTIIAAAMGQSLECTSS